MRHIDTLNSSRKNYATCCKVDPLQKRFMKKKKKKILRFQTDKGQTDNEADLFTYLRWQE